MDPRDPSIEYDWFEVGMLDYDARRKHFLVQKVNEEGRVVDSDGVPIVDGGIKNGEYF